MIAKPYLEKEQGIAVAEALLIFREVEKGFLDFAVAEGVRALDKASDIFKKVGEPYVDRYARIVEFLEPMLVPDIVKQRARKRPRTPSEH